MNAVRKQEWITALRSGQYLQAQRVLRVDDKHFCCLGVACEISQRSKWYLDMANAWNYLGRSGVIPEEVAQLYGMSENPTFKFKSYPQMETALQGAGLTSEQIFYIHSNEMASSVALSKLNDIGVSFSAIASLIELYGDLID